MQPAASSLTGEDLCLPGLGLHEYGKPCQLADVASSELMFQGPARCREGLCGSLVSCDLTECFIAGLSRRVASLRTRRATSSSSSSPAWSSATARYCWPTALLPGSFCGHFDDPEAPATVPSAGPLLHRWLRRQRKQELRGLPCKAGISPTISRTSPDRCALCCRGYATEI